MNEKNLGKPIKQHSFTLENRNKAIISGVEKVVNSADTFINLITSLGGLSIVGKGIKIEKLNLDDGSLQLSGTIDSIKYSAAKTPLFKRIFK